MNNSALIECRTLFGEKKLIPVERLIQRPSVYGLIVDDRRVLLLRGRHTGGYALPGGGIEVGERIEAALKREVHEETGIDIAVGSFLHFKEDFFYYDPLDVAIQGYLFFYHCTPLSMTLIADEHVNDGDVEKPRWIAIDGLTESDFQTQGAETIMLLEKIAAT